MTQACPRCGRGLDYSGDKPSFCMYCGTPLGPDPSAGSLGSTWTATTEGKADATVDHLGAATVAEARRHRVGAGVGAPERLAQYRLIRRLGTGGMGSVYEAEDCLSGRRVALKLIAPELVASGVAVERFVQEGRLASTIVHPRCVFVVAADECEGLPYIVMELMPGTTLRDLVEREGPLSVRDAVAKILDVIEGLREAHRRGVLHRDVKPSNCFLEADGRVKVGDFGLSKSLVADANLTRTGMFLGTPLYASPEQIRGEPLDPRADVYSASATLYYLLAGRAPFEGGDAASTLAKIVSEPVPPLRSLRPAVPRALERVVLKALRRDRARRHRDLDALREDLLPFVPERLSRGNVGRRVAAYLLDTSVPLLTVSAANIGATLLRGYRFGLDENIYVLHVLNLAFVVGYFVITETWTGASPGKYLMRLRVYRGDAAESPPLGRGLLRSAIFFGVSLVPADLVLLAAAALEWENPIYYVFHWMLRAGGFAILASTMRESNGFRGLHESLSGTRVVRLPGGGRRPSRAGRRHGRAGRPSDAARAPSRPEGMPEAVGPYRVDGALCWAEADDTRVLSGADPTLGRSVWVVLRPGDAPPPGAVRLELSRQARPRWLNGGNSGEHRWDAFIAPAGRAATDLVEATGPLPWADCREVLASLADEVSAACDDGTLPRRLSPDHVYLGDDGRVILAEFPGATRPWLPPADAPDANHAARGLALLGRVAELLLTGRVAARVDRADVWPRTLPVHARAMLDRVEGATMPYDSVEELRDDLERTADAPTELTFRLRRDRFAAFLAVATGCVAAVLLSLLAASLAIAWDTPRFWSMARAEFRSAEIGPLEEWASRYLLSLSAALPLAMAGWAFATRGGWTRRIVGLAVVDRRGRVASRVRCAVREAALWSIAILLAFGPRWLDDTFNSGADRDWVAAMTVYLLAVYACLGLFTRRRMPHDLVAGTSVVPL